MWELDSHRTRLPHLHDAQGCDGLTCIQAIPNIDTRCETRQNVDSAMTRAAKLVPFRMVIRYGQVYQSKLLALGHTRNLR